MTFLSCREKMRRDIRIQMDQRGFIIFPFRGIKFPCNNVVWVCAKLVHTKFPFTSKFIKLRELSFSPFNILVFFRFISLSSLICLTRRFFPSLFFRQDETAASLGSYSVTKSTYINTILDRQQWKNDNRLPSILIAQSQSIKWVNVFRPSRADTNLAKY